MSQRIKKVQKVAREVLGEAIQNLKDPRIGFVTVTAVRISADLRHARVFVSVLGTEEERRATMAGLASATPHLRAELGHEMRIKYLPELTFELDTGPETAERVEKLIRQIHEQDEDRLMRYDAADWDETVRVLQESEEIIIATHVNPDGDAIGSTLAAALGLQQLGKKVHSTWGTSPLVVPFNYTFLPASDTFEEPGEVPDAPVFLALDCGSSDRLGVLEPRAHASDHLINVDHHAGNTEFGKLNIVVTFASSTAELVTRLLQDLDVDIDSDIATCLYAGIVTDTGRFQYGNSSPEVMRLAAGLIERGVDWVDIAQQVFESAPFGYLKLLGRVLERAVLHEEEKFVYSWLTRGDLIETAVAMDETDKLIDAVRTTRSAEIAAMFKEQQDGSFRVSLRSKGPRSVGAIARSHGGGGHELAAGFTASSIDEAVEIVLAALRSKDV